MPGIDTYIGLRAFVDELARCGLRDACTSPGSRSTPLVLSLARDARLRSTSHVDERAAAFFALGTAKASGLPAVLACTSGTAAAGYAAAVIEAREARVPLIVLTADRPQELRDVGAGQTIDQLKLYGGAVKWFADVDDAPADAARLRWLRQLACRAVWTALDGRPGPVHLNFALREPLVVREPLPAPDAIGPGRAGGRPWVTRPRTRLQAPDALVAGLAQELERRPRALLVAGRAERDGALGPALAALAEHAGIPLLADPLSGARRGAAAIAHYDALLRDADWAAAHAPELVLRVGDLPTSKPLRGWLAGAAEALQIAVDAEGAWQDPDAVVGTLVAAEPRPLVEALTARLPRAADAAWLDGWRRADRAAAQAIATTVGPSGLSEPRVAAELGAVLPAAATLLVAASMPIRDVETFFPARPDPFRVLSNRGANGIDGTVSTAFGIAAASAGPTVLLIGDVTLAHDVGGLLAATRSGARLTIVLIDNGGGGIFDFLPVAGAGPEYEDHVATPTGLDFAHAAALYGVGWEVAQDAAGLRAALGRALAAERSTIVCVHTVRAENVALHRRVWASVAAAIASGDDSPRGSER